MKYSNTVEYNINTKLDASGLTKLQSQIKQVELSLQRMGDKEFLNSDRVSEARKQLEGLNTSLTKSFNSSLGILDLSKLQTELQTAGVDAKGLGTAFNMAGSQGQAALNNLITQIGNFNGGIERTSSQIDKIFTTFSNTFRWGLISSFFSQFMNAIHQSVDYVKELDDSLTQIMLVTDYNRDSMNQYAKSANEAAKAVSMSTTGMTNASLVFAQQGYDLNQSQELATLSAKLANASQQDTATTSDQITAYMNAYGLEGSIEELTQQMDNWALIANVSAADVGELAQASQRAASMANAVGVSGEQLAAQIATIESVTREAPEQIGNGLKTLYARFSDIAAGGEDEDGFGLGKVTAELDRIGVQVLNEMGQIRDVGDIMEDLMVIWDDLDQTSKVAASQALAGKYQVNRFMALMDNSDMYQEYKGATGNVATGTLDQMNQEYAESLAGRTQKLNTTLEGLFNDVFTTDMVYPLIDALTKLADGIDTVFKSIGDGPTILLTLASAFGQLFSTNIARSVNNMISNQQLQEVRKNNIANVGNVLDQLGLGDSEMGQYIKTMAENAPKMNQEQYDQYMAALQDWSNTTTQLAAKEEELQGTLDVLNMVYGTKLKTPSAVNKDDETGKISFTEAEEARANLSNKQLTALASKEDFVEETQQIMSLSKELGRAQTAYENFKSGIVDADKALQMFDLASDQVGQQLESLKNAGVLSEASFDQLNETFKQVTNGLITGTDDIDQLEQELDELIRRFSNLGEAASSMDPNTFKRWILSGIEQAKKQEQELQGLRTQDEQNKDTATGQIENIVSQNAIEGVIKVTSSLGELASAIMTVQNLGQILTNDDLSPMEKFVQILTGIGVLIPTVLTSIKSMSDGIKALKEAQVIENTALAAHQVLEVTNLKIKQQNIIKNIENATSMKAEMVAAAELAGVNTTLATAETAAGAAATKLAGGLASIWAALGPIGIALIGLTAILGGSALKYLWDEAKEAEAQQKALNELTDQTAETASKLNETAPALNELYDAYKQTGEASDEFKQSLESQAELLGINDAALLISQGKYEDLKTKIDEATEAIYNNNAALQQAKLDKINPNEMVNELTDDQKERYNVTYHQEEGITGITGGTATKGQVNKLDQTPYELVKAAQQDIETQQEKINSLTQKRNDLVKEGLIATGEASKKIAEDITKVDEELAEASKNLAVSKEFTEKYSDVLEASNAIRDNALNQELSNFNSIFKTGNYEDINKFISAQQGVDSSNIDILIKKYSELTGNIDAAAEATLRLQDQQIQNNQGIWKEDTISPFGDTQMRFHHYGEEGRDKLNSFTINNELSTQDKAKISDMIDWSDPDVDQKVAELLQRIQEGLDKGLSLNDALKTPENPEDVMTSFSEMEPVDTDVAEESFQNLGKYINENWEELEQLNEALGESAQFLETDADYLAEVTEAILRYQDAIDESTEKMDDWLEALDSDNFEDRSNAIAEMTDNMEDLLDLDAGTLSSDFVTAEDNIENFKDAINGVEEAYDQLYHDAVAEEVLHIEADDTQAMAVFDECWAALNEFDGYANTEFELTANDAQAITALENLLNSLGLVGDAAVEAAKAMGYEIELEPGEVEANDTQEVVGFTPREVTTPWSASIMPSADPNAGPGAALAAALNPVTASGVYSGVAYDQQNYSDVATKKTSAAGMKVKTGTGESSGGGVKIKSLKRIAPTGGAKTSMSGRDGGGGGGGGSCFVAGTKISTYFGFKNIEDIQKNDIVLSYNEKTQQNEYSIVLQTMIHNVVEPIYTLYIKNEQLRVTGIHRFLVKRNNLEWTPAQDIKIGDWILFADGTWHLIWKIDINIEHQIVYNFEVSNNHNYYVGYNQILAHNKGGKGSCFVAGTLVTTDSSFKPIEQIQKDDIVLSYNEKLGINEYSKVLQTMIHNTIEPIYTLHIKNEKLRVTGIHRFFATNKIINSIPQWVHAADLKVGDWVLFADGTWHVIHKIDIDIEYQTVYNFEVSHNHNYYVGCNQILAHNKGGKGGGGGGGGSAKTIKPKEKKEHEKNYYEEVNNQLKKNEKVLSKIEKENDRLTGDKARANYDKQIELLQKEIKLQEKKLKILTEQEKVDVEAKLKTADKELEDLLNQNNITWKIPDPIYDEDGIISNYEQISEAIDKAHNEMIDKYNAAAAAGDEELTKQIEEQISKIDKKGEDLLKKAKRMNEIQTEIEDITATLENLKDSVEDIRIEVYKASQEALKDLKKLKEEEAEIDALFHDANPDSFIDRWTIDGTPFVELKKTLQEINSIYNVSADDARAYYDTLISEKQKALETASEDEKKAIQSTIDFYMQQKGLLSDDDPVLENGLLGMRQRNLEQLKKWMDNPSDPSNPFGDNIKALKEAYQEEYEATLEDAKEARELGQEARDKYLDTMEDISDELDRHIDKYDILSDQLENISDAYQLYYGEDNYDDILNIMNQQANVAEQKMQQLETAYNYWLNRYNEALKTGDETIIHDAEERVKDIQGVYADAAKEAAEYFVAIYEKTIDSSIQKMTNKLWGGGPGQMDLEDQSTIWELQKDYMDNYKDDVEKSFEIDKLRSKYISLLNDAQGMSLQTQNKIRAQMQDQLDLLQNQATMSEYDVKLANAKLEILQKQIALEDAQRNKNKMQLRRDTQGNYRYVYTADQGDVQQAQDELNESKYDAYEMTKEQTIANNDRAISLYNDYMEKVAAISKKYQDDEAAREAALAALSDEYREIFKALREDYADTTNGMYDLLTWMIDNTTSNTTDAAMNMLDRLYDKNGEVKENTGIAWRDLATNITDNVLDEIEEATQEMLEDINISAKSLASTVAGPNGPLSKIGATANTLTGTLNKTTSATAQLGAATRELFGYLAADDGELARATNQMAEYEEKLKGALSETSKLGEALRVANENLKAKTEEALNYKLQIDRLLSGEDIIENGRIVTGEELRKRKEEEAARQAQQNDNWSPYSDAYGIWMHGDWGGGGYWYGNYAAANGTWKADQVLALFNSGYGYSWMDTGGYTGDWTENEGIKDAKSGKLAVLHKKELVLNATDTENILGAVSIIRKLSNNLQNNLGNLAIQSANQNNISGMYSPSTTEQRVEIQATFPNATDADDIRTALLGLSDKAFQYAHRTI